MNRPFSMLWLIGIVAGLLLLAYGTVVDPFSIPFQDYDQRSRRMSTVRWTGIALVIGSLLMWVIHRRRK